MFFCIASAFALKAKAEAQKNIGICFHEIETNLKLEFQICFDFVKTENGNAFQNGFDSVQTQKSKLVQAMPSADERGDDC